MGSVLILDPISQRFRGYRKDTDPTSLISFNGAKAIPKYTEFQDTALYLQANIIIDFFKLNRDGLQRKRADWLYKAIWQAVKLADLGDTEATEILRLAQTEYAPYSNCATCFINLCSSNRPEANEKVSILKRILKVAQ